MKLHDAYVSKWGVDLAAAPHTPSPAAAAYIDFITAIIQNPEETGTFLLLYAYTPAPLFIHQYLSYTHTYTRTQTHIQNDIAQWEGFWRQWCLVFVYIHTWGAPSLMHFSLVMTIHTLIGSMRIGPVRTAGCLQLRKCCWMSFVLWMRQVRAVCLFFW